MIDAKPKRRWFRFGLRTLFVLVTVIGAWLGYHFNWIRERHKLIGLYGLVSLAWRSDLQPPDIPISLRLLGEHRVNAVRAPKSEAEHAHRLFPEAEVFSFPDSEIALDWGLRHQTEYYIPPLQALVP
jgi:hypothetical protein